MANGKLSVWCFLENSLEILYIYLRKINYLIKMINRRRQEKIIELTAQW